VKADEFGMFGQRQRLDHERLGLIETKLVKQTPDQSYVRPTCVLNIINGQRNAHGFPQILVAAAVAARD
jgi:hypothetical protein